MAAFSNVEFGSSRAPWLSCGGGGSGGQELPAGSCNFRDTGTGAHSACGCQRFWLNAGPSSAQPAVRQGAWCFCGHHACFHDAFTHQHRMQDPVGGESRGSGTRDAMNPGVQGVSALRQTPSFQQAPAGYVPARQGPMSSPKPAGLGIQPGPVSQPQSINTRVWESLNNFARYQEQGDICGGASRLPSTAPQSVSDCNGSIQGPSLHQQTQSTRQMGPPVSIPQFLDARPSTEDYSATEVATPSIAGTPDFRETQDAPNGYKLSPAHLRPTQFRPQPRSQPSVVQSPQPQSAIHANRSMPQPEPQAPQRNEQELLNLVRNYGHRLDALENLSFSHVPAEEIYDRFEHVDGRLLDLEQYRIDHEKVHEGPPESPPQASASRKNRRRLFPNETSSFGSDVSFDLNAAAHAEASLLATLATDAQFRPRIESLEQNVADLQDASLPSLVRPWHLQVVLLPFGCEMRGVFFTAAEATQRSLKSTPQPSTEWGGAQASQASSFKLPEDGAWTTESIEAWADETEEWLSPKACGPHGTVFQRLASRGLVQDILVTGSDAHHIQSALVRAFGDVLETHSDGKHEGTKRYQGLNERFIPLRKVRKSSRLRFLSSAEMVTSSIWTAQFLQSSIMMNVSDGPRRLYVTTPAAYIQRTEMGCSWPSIRKLPVFNAAESEQAVQADKVTIEACWTYNEQLDRPVSTYSSFASQMSPWSAPDQSEGPDADLPDLRPSLSVSEAPPPRQRTVSMPVSHAPSDQQRDTVPKRRVASFQTAGHSRHVSEESNEIAAKRRRISLSPRSVRRGMNCFTPRWSREPPSPFTSEPHQGEARSQGTSSRNRRGTTPFAYATPHSNTHYPGAMDFTINDGDTEPDTDSKVDRSEIGEEEWEGVVDDDGPVSIGDTNFDGGESDVDDSEMDEDDEMDVGFEISED